MTQSKRLHIPPSKFSTIQLLQMCNHFSLQLIQSLPKTQKISCNSLKWDRSNKVRSTSEWSCQIRSDCQESSSQDKFIPDNSSYDRLFQDRSSKERSSQDTLNQDRLSQLRLGQNRTGQVSFTQDRVSKVRTGQARKGQVRIVKT